MKSKPNILMCPPDYFGIEYEINPWMDKRRPADRELAMEQWLALRSILSDLGVAIAQISPVAGLPDMVFTANAAMIFRRKAILSRFRPQQRRGEEEHNTAWLSASGFEILPSPKGTFFEGAGDALFCGDTLFAGYRMRSDARGLQEVGAMIGCRVIPLELVDPYYYHLDTCFCPLLPGLAIYHPAAFDDYGQRVLPELIDELIPLVPNEAASFAANAVVVGRTVVTNVGCPQLHRDLSARGFTAIATPLGEFVKAGGSAKCLTLRLDGEDAAPD
jgi:N-dimethylarginine dimethylaminohydrolase